MSINIPETLERLCYRYPSPLVDAVTEHEPGRRMVAVKNVSVSEEFFQGHFPGTPLMPGVLMIETLAQVAALLLMHGSEGASGDRVFLRGVDNAKFRKSVVPGDRLRLEVTLGPRRAQIARAKAAAYIDDTLVAEAELVMGLIAGAEAVADRPMIDPTAVVHPAARIGAGTRVEPHAVIGGFTEIGDGNEVFPMASIGLIPQDLKFGGEQTRVVIGHRNVIREFVTIHRGTKGGGGVTSIGDDNLFMAYTHIAHDCQVGHNTIFANAATLAGHVEVEDYATVGAFSGVHQYCRVGKYAFIGGYSVVTKDALPFAKTVGNRARIYGLNKIGLVRRKFAADSIDKLHRAYRILLHSNTSRALAQIARDPKLKCEEVEYLLEFIRSSRRGVGLRRPSRRVEEDPEE